MNLEKSSDNMVQNIQNILKNQEIIAQKIDSLTATVETLKKEKNKKEKKILEPKFTDDYYEEVSREEKDIYSTVVPGLKLRKEITINYGLKPTISKNEQ